MYSGLHCVGYIDHLLKSVSLYSNEFMDRNLKLEDTIPPVAIIIPTLNEEPDMVEETILRSKNVDYGNFQVILVR